MTRKSNRAATQPLCFALRSILLPLHSKLSGKHFAAMSPTLTKNGAQKKGHTSQFHHTHTFKFFTSAKTALSNHAGLLMSVVTKPVKAWTGIKGKRIESVSWPGNTQFPQDDLSSAEIVFPREAARAQRDHVFCIHKKDSEDHSVLIFQPPKEDSLRKQAKSGQVGCTRCYVLFSRRSLLPEIQIPTLLNVVNI